MMETENNVVYIWLNLLFGHSVDLSGNLLNRKGVILFTFSEMLEYRPMKIRVGGEMRAILIIACFVFFGSAFSQNWESQGIVLDRGPDVIHHDSTDDALYFGGNFLWLNGQPAAGVVKFDGLQWTALPPGNPIRAVRGISRFQGKLLVYGFEGIGSWDGVQWDTIVQDAVVYEMRLVDNNEMIVAGIFRALNGDSINAIARWDGNSFRDEYQTYLKLAAENFRLTSTIDYQGDLFAAGNIDIGDSLKEIARWNGSQWLSVGGGIGGGGSAWINDMEIFQGELYVGGYFFEQNGSPGNCIARWNGQRWDRVGDGLGPGQVFDLYNYDGKLYVTGAFSYANGVRANCIATWDGNEWCSLGHQIDNVITCVQEYHGELYIGGGFWTIDDDSIKFLAKWIGGNYVDSCVFVPVGLPELTQAQGISLFPNPTQSHFALAPVQQAVMVRVLDFAGREVVASRVYWAGSSPVSVEWLPAGIYFVEVSWRGRVEVIKLVKE